MFMRGILVFTLPTVFIEKDFILGSDIIWMSAANLLKAEKTN